MVAFALRLAAAATFTLCLAPGAVQDAQARGAFDGSWSVSISGRSGTCDGLSYSYAVNIVNNVVHYSGGDAQISGSVNAGGSLSVRVSGAGTSAGGSGKLSARSGSGRFRGNSATGTCGGVWSATRTGG
jgi:hypothetical protein